MTIADGRQRLETIVRYLQGQFALKPQGLDRLWNLAGKTFQELDENLRERILDTRLRLMVIEAKDKDSMSPQSEEAIKREIFKRYNIGISPLRKEEVFKAQYLQDEINIFFKDSFAKDKPFFALVTEVFDHRKRNLETMMQHIRQLLVIHHVPINRYLYQREDIINKYYDYLSYTASKQGVEENVQAIYDNFTRKVGFLHALKMQMDKKGTLSEGLIFECLYWALSVCEEQGVPVGKLDNAAFRKKLLAFITENVRDYRKDFGVYYQQVREVYNLLASFFATQLEIPFDNYLKSNDEFIVKHRERMEQYLQERFRPGEEQANFSKMIPTFNTVADTLDRMKRGKFDLRPPYQRNEVMDVKKASSLIESLLLGVKLNPIFVYVREDGVVEVIDGQQRLLAIIAFLAEQYRNSAGELETSRKHNFRLQLQSGLMPHLHGMRFDELPDPLKRRLKDCDISMIEIKEQDNKHFKPEELFKRINHKPCPIKPHSFELWNAYVDYGIINEIKRIHERNDWLYVRKDDKRMINQEMVACLCFLHFSTQGATSRMAAVKEVLSTYATGQGLVVKIKDKADVTALLENPIVKGDFLLSMNGFELDFIEKVKLLISDSSGKMAGASSNRRLDALFHTRGMRAAMSFYVLWWVLSGVSLEYVREEPKIVKTRINMVFSLLKKGGTVEKLEKLIAETWALSRLVVSVE